MKKDVENEIKNILRLELKDILKELTIIRELEISNKDSKEFYIWKELYAYVLEYLQLLQQCKKFIKQGKDIPPFLRQRIGLLAEAIVNTGYSYITGSPIVPWDALVKKEYVILENAEKIHNTLLKLQALALRDLYKENISNKHFLEKKAHELLRLELQIRAFLKELEHDMSKLKKIIIGRTLRSLFIFDIYLNKEVQEQIPKIRKITRAGYVIKFLDGTVKFYEQQAALKVINETIKHLQRLARLLFYAIHTIENDEKLLKRLYEQYKKLYKSLAELESNFKK